MVSHRSSPPLASGHPDRYKWTALSNTTLGVFMATLDASILVISLPAIFRGIHLDPLQPGNINYLLWTLMGYMVVTAVLVVTFGRLGDMFGRVRTYNAGFAVFTLGSIALSLTPGQGSTAAMYLIILRIVQGIGGAMLMANASAILTDAFPVAQRGLAMGISTVAAISGGFIGLILGGVLAEVDWRLVFWVNVPFGIFGTIWAYLKLHEVGVKVPSKVDWPGNITFAGGLIAVLIGITYGIQPYGHDTMGWTSPRVLSVLLGGVGLLALFVFIEHRVENPMFNLSLFKIRAFTAGNIASLFSSIGRGGLQFMLIIWLQGIWLPLHGYSFKDTPLWAGIYMLPLTIGFLAAGPLCGHLSDRHGSRLFATSGMLVSALALGLLTTLPADFHYFPFAALLLLSGLASGLFAAPNGTAVMNSAPPSQRGQASGMRATGMNAGMVLSIGLFFSLMIAGLASTLPRAMSTSLEAQGVAPAVAQQVASEPPVGSLFAAFLGYNPMEKLVPASTLDHLPAANRDVIVGKTFFPRLIASPFMHGLRIAFGFSVILALIAALASFLRGAPAPLPVETTPTAEREAAAVAG